MEDGIERNSYNLLLNQVNKEKQKETENTENTENTEKKEESKTTKDYLYIYIPDGGEWEDFVITDTSEKALKLVKKNNGRIEIFKKDVNGLYKPTYI